MAEPHPSNINKVAYNVDQRNDPYYTPAMRKQARKNIGFWYYKRQTINKMPDYCNHTTTVPNSTTTRRQYLPYENAKKCTFFNDHEYHLSVFSTPIELEDTSAATYSYRLSVAGIYLTPWIQRRVGEEINCTIDWDAEGIPDAAISEDIEHCLNIDFSSPLKEGLEITISIAGTWSDYIQTSEV